MRRSLLLIILSILVVTTKAQQRSGAAPASVTSVNTAAGKVYYAEINEAPRAIEFKARTVTPLQFISRINEYLGLPAEATYTELESNIDKLGMKHRLLQQHYKGVRVEGMFYRTHEKDGFMVSANGRAVRELNPDLNTRIQGEDAFRIAINHLQSRDTVITAGKKLIVSKGFTYEPGSFAVAYQFDIDVSLLERWRISIDARTGEVINKISLVQSCGTEPAKVSSFTTGTGKTNYYGSQAIQVEKYANGSSTMVGQTANGGNIGTFDFANANILGLFFGYYKIYNFYSGDNTYNDDYYKPAVSVQWGAEKAYEYYYTKHRRNSFDDMGGQIVSYVHVDRDLDNAFWTGRLMAFGDGSNKNPLVELDIVSHELTHGVTQYEAALQYFNEPGALNESFSDIFGKAVEFHTFGDTATWHLGRRYRPGGLRDFSNPNLKNQPDTYAGNMWYTGYDDNGGVHYNSGVQNYWFYLLCEGGSGTNDHQFAFNVNSVGMETAVNIAYRNLTEYLIETSDYLDCRIGSMLATADLYGKHSAVYQEVDKAWDAVGVIDEPIITDLQLYDITSTTVKMKGSLLPRGSVAHYSFQYGTTPALGQATASYAYTDKIEGILTGLQSQTHYYLRLLATNENGTTTLDTEFTTISPGPLVKIKETADVTETTAVFYGALNPNSLPGTFYFEYGTTPALGQITASYPVSAASEFGDVSAVVANLVPKSVYYYRLVATNSFSSATTESVSFFTATRPVIISVSPVAAAPGAEVVIRGNNFNAAPQFNQVNFGATRATIIAASPGEITVQVPVGASFGNISVTDLESGLIAESIEEFIPTFTGEFTDGSLQMRVAWPDVRVYSTQIEDMDGDGRPDIVGTHYQGFSVFLNVNQGGPLTNESFVRNITPVLDYASGSIYTVDLDGNGLADVIMRYAKGLRIHPNLSVPGYTFFGVPVELPIGWFDYVVFEDFDLDGHIDIGIVKYGPDENGHFRIFRNENPRGSLRGENFREVYDKTLAYVPGFLTASDLNNDGLMDLMVGANNKPFVSILINESRQGASGFTEIRVEDLTRNYYVRYIGHDLNQDGWKDIVSHSPNSEASLTLWENNTSSPTMSFGLPSVSHSGKVAYIAKPADINGDGKLDLIAGAGDRRFAFLKNKVGAKQPLTSSALENFSEFGMGLPDINGGTIMPDISINDLNGDGRPEIIACYEYYYGPHDGNWMEIWQNSPSDCIDPTKITVDVTNTSATIVLPPNTVFDDFEFSVSSGNGNWYPVSSIKFYLTTGATYKLRIRAKCYVYFTNFHYIDIIASCVDLTNVGVSNITANDAYVTAPDISTLEVQYSVAGRNEWTTLAQFDNHITGLTAGTKYDLRVRGRCDAPDSHKYFHFTTPCGPLPILTITNTFYNKARLEAKGTGTLMEYSPDELDWIVVPESGIIEPLMSGHQYFVRAKKICPDLASDYVHSAFRTLCPEVSNITESQLTPYGARFDWTDESNTGVYFVNCSLRNGPEIASVKTTSTYVIFEDLQPGTSYTVSVAPECKSNRIFTSFEFSTVCYTPSNVYVSDVTQTSALLTWDVEYPSPSYPVAYSIRSTNQWVRTSSDNQQLSLTGLRPGTQYEVRVFINCPDFETNFTPINFETGLYRSMTFGPNPTHNTVTINPDKNLIGRRFILMDNTGREVTGGELRSYTYDFTFLAPGLYIFKIDGEKAMKITRE